MLNDIGAPDDQIARFLDLAPATVRRYRAAGQAPRPIMLALFWETSWGRNWRETALQNEVRQAYAKARILTLRNDRLVKQMLTMEQALELQKGAANGPLFHIG